MERRPLASRWQAAAWRPVAVEPGGEGDQPHALSPSDDSGVERWFHPGFAVELFRDEAEGYYLNLDSPAAFVFVKWEQEADRGVPIATTLSYHEAARWMDGGATVDGVPMPPDWVPWLFDFVTTHYRPEPKKRRIRPDSFNGARRDS